MDLLSREENENWYALLAAILAAFVFATAVGYLLPSDGDEDPVARRRHKKSRFDPEEPSIVQAPWRVVAKPLATLGKPTKKQKRAMAVLRPKVAATVRDLYDALTISRANVRTATNEAMTVPAARALRSRLPVPESLRRIKTTRRAAEIGIDLKSQARAAAKVTIAFQAEKGKDQLAYSHNGTLWLERTPKGWQVIAFDLDQKLKQKPKKGQKKSKETKRAPQGKSAKPKQKQKAKTKQQQKKKKKRS